MGREAGGNEVTGIFPSWGRKVGEERLEKRVASESESTVERVRVSLPGGTRGERTDLKVEGWVENFTEVTVFGLFTGKGNAL